MRLLLRLIAGLLLLGVVGCALAVGDLALNRGRGLDALLGRDALVAACRPVLEAKLKAAGFEPDDLTFGEDVTITVSTSVGRTLSGDFTFEDGAARSRVDGLLACVVSGKSVTVDMRTRSAPARAT